MKPRLMAAPHTAHKEGPDKAQPSHHSQLDQRTQHGVCWSPSSRQHSFGSERRWYQPGQAADRAAALQQQALAAAAAERQIDDASWLLATAPQGRSLSNQRCTFGSELRWWESRDAVPSADNSNSRKPSPQRPPASDQARQQLGDAVPHMQGRCAPSASEHSKFKKCTFGSAARWWESPHSSAPQQQHAKQPSQVSAVLDRLQAQNLADSAQQAASMGRADMMSPEQAAIATDDSAKAALHGANRGRSLSPASGAGLSVLNWRHPDSSLAPGNSLHQIQQEHNRGEQLAAMISQRSVARQAARSTFGSDSRWYDKGVAAGAAPGSPIAITQARVDDASHPKALQGINGNSMMEADRSLHSKLSSTASKSSQPSTHSSLKPNANAHRASVNTATPPSTEEYDHRTSATVDAAVDSKLQPGSRQGSCASISPSRLRRTSTSTPSPSPTSALGPLDMQPSSSKPASLSIQASSAESQPYAPSSTLQPATSLMSPRAWLQEELPSQTWSQGDWASHLSPGSPTLGRSRSGSPSTWRRTASICDRSGLRESLRTKSASLCLLPICLLLCVTCPSAIHVTPASFPSLRPLVADASLSSAA